MSTSPAPSGMLFLDDLFEVQRKALEEAGDKSGFAFFLEQGLGKTRTVLYEFHFKAVRDLADVLVVVCPKSLKETWEDETTELGMVYPVHLVESAKKCFKWLNEKKPRKFILVFNYEQVMTHGTDVLKALLERHKRVYIALDESVRIKAFDSVVGERLYQLSNAIEKIKQGKKTIILDVAAKRSPAAFRRTLSGTPAPQGPHDLWNQFRFLGMMKAIPYHGFRNLYCRMGGYLGKKVLGAQNLDLLRERTGHFVFRAKKKDWTDLPEKLWAKPRSVDMTEAQRRAYLEIMHDFVLELGPNDFVTVEMAITVKNKLQQIASGWIYDNDHNVREIVPLEDNPKLNEAADLVNDIIAGGSKILVFYFFKPTRSYLAQLAEREGWGHVFLESGLKGAELKARKDAFNNDDNVKVAFCQTDAIKEGHTLLGTEAAPCYNTLFVENTYSLYARSQAEDRNHRHGQRNPVTYHDIVTSREDKAIIKALQTKANLQEMVLAEFTAYRPDLNVAETSDESFDI